MNYDWKFDHRPIIYAINKSWDLPKLIAERLGLKLNYLELDKFSDDEFKLRASGHCRRGEVYLIVENSPADELLQVQLAIDALYRASAGEINLVFPYPGWLRQDRIKNPHECLSAKKIYGDLDQSLGVVRFIVMDPHITQANLAVNHPWENLFSSKIFIDYFRNCNEIDLSDSTVVASDFGIIHTAMYIARKLGTNLAIIDKYRLSDTEIRPKRLIVEGKLKSNLIFVDDIISTFGTGMSDIEFMLKNNGKDKQVYMAAPHAVLVGPALERINNSPVKMILTTNTVHIPEDKKHSKITILSSGEIFSDCIYQVHCELGSVSSLYDPEQRS